ncbi:hypothetical protein TcG_10344 [Trypanosoma cruzi]|nr:hypothetical protein TcG_10344 [Trypanosoma cruzi]
MPRPLRTTTIYCFCAGIVVFLSFCGLFFFFLRSHNIFFCFTITLLEEIWFLCLLHGASPCVLVAMLPSGAKAFDGVFILLFASCSRPCLAMAAAGGILRLRARRTCLIFCRCSLAVLAEEGASDCVGGVAFQWEREGTDRC